MHRHIFNYNRIIVAVIFFAFSFIVSCNDSEDPMGPEDDTEPPSVSITSPTADAEIAGEITIEMTASDDNQVDSVQVMVDGNRIGVVTSSPFNFTWQSIAVADSMTHDISAKAFDSAENSATSDPVSVTINAPVVEFANDVQPIFTNNCAVSGCHAGASPAQGMNLSAGSSHDAIVDVAANESQTLDRIEPGSPDESYLYLKINPSPPSGSRMPLGADPLTDEQIATVNFWIEQGAEDN